MKTRYQFTCKDNDECVYYQKKKTKCKYRNWDGKDGKDWLNDCI